MLSPRATYDGMIFLPSELIRKIHTDGSKSEKLIKLMEMKKTKLGQIEIITNDELSEFLNFVKIKDMPLYIEVMDFENNALFGRLGEVTEEYISVDCLDENGFSQGIERVYIDEILLVHADSENLRDLIMLNESQAKK